MMVKNITLITNRVAFHLISKRIRPPQYWHVAQKHGVGLRFLGARCTVHRKCHADAIYVQDAQHWIDR